MAGASSSSDTATLIVASGTFLTGVGAILGKGIVWLFKWRRSHIAELKRDVQKLRDDMNEVVANCANERLESTRKIDVLVTVCIVLIDGGPHASDRAKQMLGTEFPDLLRRIYPAEDFIDIPDDLRGPLDRANQALSKPRRGRRKPQ